MLVFWLTVSSLISGCIGGSNFVPIPASVDNQKIFRAHNNVNIYEHDPRSGVAFASGSWRSPSESEYNPERILYRVWGDYTPQISSDDYCSGQVFLNFLFQNTPDDESYGPTYQTYGALSYISEFMDHQRYMYPGLDTSSYEHLHYLPDYGADLKLTPDDGIEAVDLTISYMTKVIVYPNETTPVATHSRIWFIDEPPFITRRQLIARLGALNHGGLISDRVGMTYTVFVEDGEDVLTTCHQSGDNPDRDMCGFTTRIPRSSSTPTTSTTTTQPNYEGENEDEDSGWSKAKIAIASAFGGLGLIIIGGGAALLWKRRRNLQRSASTNEMGTWDVASIERESHEDVSPRSNWA